MSEISARARGPQTATASGTSSPRALPLDGRRVTLMGLGRHGGGVAAARYLVAAGARVTVSDTADPTQLADSLAPLQDLAGLQLQLGGHRRKDFLETDLVVVNPAVRPENRYVQLARQAGVPTSSEIELFLNRCPAPIVGVTGSCGKSTTATMIAAMGQAAGRQTWLGGNIERSLLPMLDQIGYDDLVVLELSSFQLAWLNPAARRPEVAVITNCEPNHLDWHRSYEDYLAAKRNICSADPRDQRLFLGDPLPRGTPWQGGLADAGQPWPDDRLPPLAVPGRHQRRNACLAAAAAAAAGCDADAIRTALASFRGLPHRLEPLGQPAGRLFLNDSQATTPASTIAALQAVDRPCWLLAGGADKGAPLQALARQIVRTCRGAAFFGQTADALAAAVARVAPEGDAVAVPTLADGLAWCWTRSQAGDAILLSPACSSHDQYPDYAHRADDFRQQIAQLAPPRPHQQPEGRLI